MKTSFHKVHMTETYSPRRFMAEVPSKYFRAGTVFDVESGWNLSDPEQFNMARAQAAEERQALVTGTPLCSALVSPEAGPRRFRGDETYMERAMTMYMGTPQDRGAAVVT